MKARDIMNRKVVSAPPEASRRAVAELLVRNGISAIPVVDGNGAPIGMVSEGDLMPRDESEREARRDWWLKALSEGEDLNPEFVQYLESQDRSARDMMVSPVITIDVESIDESLKKVEAEGGSVVTPKTPIPGMGAFAYFKDSEGNTMGMFQSD